MENNKIKIALFEPSEKLLWNVKKLDFSYVVTGIFGEDEYREHECTPIKQLPDEKYDYVLIPYENFRKTREKLATKYNIDIQKIFTFEEIWVKDSEKKIVSTYHERWQKAFVSDFHPFKDKNVVIIGGSSGIGKECAHAFLSYGANVVVIGRNVEKLKDVCQKYSRYGKIQYMIWDITVIDEYSCKMTELQEKTGGMIDIVVNSAGIVGADNKNLFEVKEEEFDHVLGTNLKSVYFLCQSFAAYFMEHRIKGHIVNIVSNLGFLPTVKPYGISKWGLVGLTKGLGMNLAEYGIVVNGVAPGEVATPMAKWNEGGVPARRAPKTGRVSFPCEVAETVIYLAGYTGENFIGEVVVCNGGDVAINLKL